MLREGEWTHPPESTGETTRTNGGSKGKLSWKRQERVQMMLERVKWETEQQLQLLTYFVGEV